MDKERVFEIIEVIEDEIILLEKRILKMKAEVREKCLQLLKDKHNITIGVEIEGYKVSKIDVKAFVKCISCRLEGFQKEKDGSFGKKEYFIKYIYIERNENE